MALAALSARLAALSPPQTQHDAGDTRSVASAEGSTCSSPVRIAQAQTQFDTRSCHSDTTASSSSSSSYTSSSPASSDATPQTGVRANEHLAILLPRDLWKPDEHARKCDSIIRCNKSFSLRERKHHCRKCGGIFCNACSRRTTPLLDVTHLPFLNPPRGVPIAAFASPTSPVSTERVCDRCWALIHGTKPEEPAPASPASAPICVQTQSAIMHGSGSDASSSASSSPRSPPTPLDGSAIITPFSRRHHRDTRPNSPRLPSSPLRSGCSTPSLPSAPPSTPSHAHTPLPPSLSAATTLDTVSAELAAYPLRHASAICKASGGGRWAPKPAPRIVGYRVPGGKAEYEIEMEREAEEERVRRANPVKRDAWDFQVRVPREAEPRERGGPWVLSTF